ncbi:hypothetical protein [Mycobacterium sp. 1274761.0]|uniref:hypothetical protein n=1 Tax=Mycobacterium sp. 1274761.0 TaxID=1834077 RepID=UPI000801CBDC|nr:hypothetical protein [Mycobacterium sp. 1274761.0]OBK74847.1 hypothetical protein A5651_08075 [Mycobacterium sp. 1274761.0]
MKIKSIAAVGAMGLGLGVASFIAGTGTASADQCGTPPFGLHPANIACVTNAEVGDFLRTTSPQYNIDVFLHGQNETAGDPSTNNGLGILDQPKTFVDSVGEFLGGPKAPDPAPESGSGF